MNKYVYIQNSELEYLTNYGMVIRWDSKICSALNLKTVGEAKAVVKNNKLSDVWITTMNYIK